jgi:uncharacterized membrane protein YjjP (DUF1212 family)
MGEQSENTAEPKGFVWTQEAVKDVEGFIEHIADKYLTYKKNEAEANQRLFEAESKHNRNMVISLIVFLSFIVLGMSYLTLSGHVSDDALLFLIGTITGYLLLFIQRLVFAGKERESQELSIP